MSFGFTKEQVIKVAKTALYVAISAVLAFAISALSDTPELFGIYTPVINLALVTLKQFFSEDKSK